MSDWIELKRLDTESKVYPMSIRTYNIETINKLSDGSTAIYVESERHPYYTVAESYEDVMAKVKDTEGPGPIIEHFTKNEYELILETMERLDNPSKSAQNIIKELKAILKEDE